ncbi:MAG: hypothetical protein IPL77_09910 [Flavobacteriales bacterium]|nr:hypothetical protein [Flavobacteriales bacterium]
MFISFFFVSIGMLPGPDFPVGASVHRAFLHPAHASGKTAITALAALVLRYPLRTALLTGFALARW